MESENKCPVSHGAESQHTQGARSNHQWWPDNINLDILYEDKDLIVVNKPAGISVHPSLSD